MTTPAPWPRRPPERLWSDNFRRNRLLTTTWQTPGQTPTPRVDYDARMTVIVIGGGPAGSLAALLLARGGAAVRLIEQSRFPRDKVCGECLSALGRSVLRRHGLEPPLAAVGTALSNAVLIGRTMHARLSLPSPMLGISRSFMDDALLNAASVAGVQVLQPARVEAVESQQAERNEDVGCVEDGERGASIDNATRASPPTNLKTVFVRVRDLPTNRMTELSADWCVIADGRDALSPTRRPATGVLGIKATFTDVAADADAVTLYGGFGCYGGVAPIEAGRWDTAFAVPRELLAAARGDLAAVWARLRSQSPAMDRHFSAATLVGEWLASPLPRHGLADDWPARVIPVGAAAWAIEPIGGEGIGTSLRSAELAAEAILADRTETLRSAYSALWRRRSFFCALGGRLLSDPNWSDGVTLASVPLVGRLATWLVGK